MELRRSDRLDPEETLSHQPISSIDTPTDTRLTCQKPACWDGWNPIAAMLVVDDTCRVAFDTVGD
jgi:hypothetical protein